MNTLIDKNFFSKSSEELYKSIFKNIPVLAYIWKKVEDDLILIDFSHELEKRGNINLEKYIGTKASELYKKDPEFLNDLKRCMNEKRIISKEMVYKSKLITREKNVNVTFQYIPKDMILVYIEDISEQKEIEESLKKEEKERSIVLETISEHIIYYDKEFNIISANKSAADSINLNPEELIGRKCYELWHNQNEPCEGCPVIKAFKSGKLTTAEMKTPDGRIWLVKGHPLYDNKGDIIGVVEITRDITKLKHIEQRLKESEEKYKNLVDNILDQIIETNLDGTITYVSPQVFNIFGFKPEEALGKRSIDFVHPNDKAILKESMKRAIDSGEIISSQFRLRHKDGHYLLVSSRGSLIKKDEKTKLVAVVRDISEQKLTEKKLRDSEQQYRTTLDSMGDAIHVIDNDMRIILFNPALEKWVVDLGLKTDLIGKKLNEAFPFLPERVTNEYKQVFNSGEALFTDETTEFMGKVLFTESRKIPIFREGKVYQIITVVRDINERKIAEQKLRESEERFRKFFKGGPHYATVWRKVDNDFIVVDINDNYRYAVKKDLNEVIGKSASEMFLKQQYRPDLVKSLNQCYNEKTTFSIERELYVEAVNRERNLLITLIYIPPDLVLTVSEDITRKKRAQQKLEESEEKYRKAYNRADFYKDLFAHDMNNILQNIYSASQLSVMDLDENKAPSKLKENLDIILDQVNRGARLVSNVRKLTKLEESVPKHEDIDALNILNKSIAFIKNAYQNKDIDIRVSSKIEKSIVNADNLLEDVFENILINAIKYNENSPIKILIGISKDLKDDKSYIKFEFKDNGIGIDDSRKKDIFLRNHQTEASRRGMGLGLSLVRKIIANYKGHIWVEDNVLGDHSKGSKFIFLIPIED